MLCINHTVTVLFGTVIFFVLIFYAHFSSKVSTIRLYKTKRKCYDIEAK